MLARFTTPAFRALFLIGALTLVQACGDDAPSDSGQDATADTAPSDTAPQDMVIAPAPSDLRLATWNVENLFDSVNDPEKDDDVLSIPERQEKIRRVARVLTALDADIVALQEVENAAILDELADAVSGLGYTERVIFDNANDGRGIDVAFLSRRPITRKITHAGEWFEVKPDCERTFARDALEIFVRVGTREVGIATVHFISMLRGSSSSCATNDERRPAEAAYVAQIAQRNIDNGNDTLIVAGDFNDFPGSDTLDALVEDGPFEDLTLGIPSGDRWTYDHEQLDHMLGTPNAASGLQSIEIIHLSDVESASDHSPIVANFWFE